MPAPRKPRLPVRAAARPPYTCCRPRTAAPRLPPPAPHPQRLRFSSDARRLPASGKMPRCAVPPLPALRGCLEHFPHFLSPARVDAALPAELRGAPPPPPPRGPPAGRAAWEGGRAWKQRESVRSSGWRGMEEKPATMRASALSLPPSPRPFPSAPFGDHLPQHRHYLNSSTKQ